MSRLTELTSKSNAKAFVFVRTTFAGFHRWKDAPESVAFLRAFHRHVFHVELTVHVTHDNREKEFFTLKEALDDYLAITWLNQKFEDSCEQVARNLSDRFQAFKVIVSEDGENGAAVINSNNQ